ncbi:hypothetical protein MA16_Dca016847 [Dendrobium catenatum]|uniref:Uncharacterized protein n=1 Tax=Dendrobium catenatum TaxID=906689 RepID=A0A2I0WNN9_9ASPA|nr:hypothetical protein MA16_Dca016847 [Dendrobium catenatum]
MAKFGFFFSHCHLPGTQAANRASFSASRVRMPPLPLAVAADEPPSASLPYTRVQLPADASRPDHPCKPAKLADRCRPTGPPLTGMDEEARKRKKDRYLHNDQAPIVDEGRVSLDVIKERGGGVTLNVIGSKVVEGGKEVI